MSWQRDNERRLASELWGVEDEEPRRPQLAPGKRTLTSRLPPLVQRKESTAAAPAADRVDVPMVGGDPLPPDLRVELEGALGTDLGPVRVHTGEDAGRAAEGLSARAFTAGYHISFAPGEYDPTSTEGRELVAHEVAHTVQQAGASARSAPQTKLEVSHPGDALEVEADRFAAAFVRGERTPVTGAAGMGAVRIQRKESSGPDNTLTKEAFQVLAQTHVRMKDAKRWIERYFSARDQLANDALQAGRHALGALDRADELLQAAYGQLSHPELAAAAGSELSRYFEAANRIALKLSSYRDLLRQRAGIAWFRGPVPGIEPIVASDTASLLTEIAIGAACNRIVGQRTKSVEDRDGFAEDVYHDRRNELGPREMVYVEHTEAFLTPDRAPPGDSEQRPNEQVPRNTAPASPAEWNARNWSDAELQGRRAGARAQLSQDSLASDHRAGIANDLGALDLEAHRRGLQAAQAAFSPPEQPPANPVDMRNTLEQAVAAGGFPKAEQYVRDLYETAANRIPPRDPRRRALLEAWQLGQRQLAILRKENEAFLAEFEVKAKARMSTMLAESDTQIRAELAGYGVPWTPELDGILDKIVDTETSTLFRLGQLGVGGSGQAILDHIRQSTAKAVGGQAPAQQERRIDLQLVVRELFVLQEVLDSMHRQRLQHLMAAVGSSPEAAADTAAAAGEDIAVDVLGGVSPGLEAVVRARGRGGRLGQALRDPSKVQGLDPEVIEQDRALQALIQAQTKRLEATWIAHEAEHPILATWRGGASRETIRRIATGTGEEANENIARACVERLANIKKARVGLAKGKYTPWALPAVVDMTKREASVAPGSMRDQLVSERAAAAQGTSWADVAIFALTLALAALAAPFTGGGSLVAAAEVGGLLLDAYLIYGQVEQYDYDKAAAGTHFDQAKALSQSEPSLAWLAVELVFAGIGGAQAIKMFGHGATLRHAIESGDDAEDLVRELDELGEQHGLGKLGSKVEKRYTSEGAETRPLENSGTPRPVVLAGADADVALVPQYVPREPGTLQVFTHGSVDDFIVKTESGEVRLDHRAIAHYIRKSRQQYERVKLYSCLTGKHPKGAAQHLANKLGVDVVAPSQPVWLTDAGDIVVGTRVDRPNGEWVTFSPKKSSMRYAKAPDAGDSAKSADEAADVGTGKPLGSEAGEIGRGKRPSDFGLVRISEDPKLLNAWNDTLKTLGSSGKNNAYKRYLTMLEETGEVDETTLKKAWKYASEEFKRRARELGYEVAEVHHWNFPKLRYKEQVFDSRNLSPVPDRDAHSTVHEATSGGANRWKGPVKDEDIIVITEWTTLLEAE